MNDLSPQKPTLPDTETTDWSSLTWKLLLTAGLTFCVSFQVVLWLNKLTWGNNASVGQAPPPSTPLISPIPEPIPASSPTSVESFKNLAGMPDGRDAAVNPYTASYTGMRFGWQLVKLETEIQTASPPAPITVRPLPSDVQNANQTVQAAMPLPSQPMPYGAMPVALAPQENVTGTASTATSRPAIGSFAAGMRGKAYLVNAAIFSSDRGGKSPEFLAMLEEPLRAGDGKVVIPANATVIAIARPIDSGRGTTELQAVSVLVDGREYALPAGAIALRDPNGEPIQAEVYTDSQTESPSANAANVIEIERRAAAPSSAEATPTSTDQIKSRNRLAIESVMRQSKFFVIPQGRGLQLVVERDFSL